MRDNLPQRYLPWSAQEKCAHVSQRSEGAQAGWDGASETVAGQASVGAQEDGRFQPEHGRVPARPMHAQTIQKSQRAKAVGDSACELVETEVPAQPKDDRLS